MNRRNEGGFTLIEVITALVVFLIIVYPFFFLSILVKFRDNQASLPDCYHKRA